MLLRHKLAVLLGGVLGLFCGVLGLLSAASLTLAQPANAVLEKIRAGQEVKLDEAATAARVSYAAARFFEPGRHLSDAALAISAMPRRARLRDLRDMPTYAQVIDQSLAARPLNPYGWARRADESAVLGRFEQAKAALDMSLTTGRMEPGLTVPRLGIIQRLMQLRKDPEVERAFESQARLAAQTEPQALANMAIKQSADGLLQRALYHDLDAYGAYLRQLRQARDTMQDRAGRVE